MKWSKSPPREAGWYRIMDSDSSGHEVKYPPPLGGCIYVTVSSLSLADWSPYMVSGPIPEPEEGE